MSREHRVQDSSGVVIVNDAGLPMWVIGSSVPADTTADYGSGCVYQDNDDNSITGMAINIGSTTSANFDDATVAS